MDWIFPSLQILVLKPYPLYLQSLVLGLAFIGVIRAR